MENDESNAGSMEAIQIAVVWLIFDQFQVPVVSGWFGRDLSYLFRSLSPEIDTRAQNG